MRTDSSWIFGVEFLWSHLLVPSFDSSLADISIQCIFSFTSQDALSQGAELYLLIR